MIRWAGMADRVDFSSYYAELLDGIYNCVDRIVLDGYYPLGMSGGGFRTWWRALTNSDDTRSNEALKRLAGRFSRRVRAWAEQHTVTVIDCPAGARKHLVAAEHLPKEPNFMGLPTNLWVTWMNAAVRPGLHPGAALMSFEKPAWACRHRSGGSSLRLPTRSPDGLVGASSRFRAGLVWVARDLSPGRGVSAGREPRQGRGSAVAAANRAEFDDRNPARLTSPKALLPRGF